MFLILPATAADDGSCFTSSSRVRANIYSFSKSFNSTISIWRQTGITGQTSLLNSTTLSYLQYIHAVILSPSPYTMLILLLTTDSVTPHICVLHPFSRWYIWSSFTTHLLDPGPHQSPHLLVWHASARWAALGCSPTLYVTTTCPN